MWSRLAAAVLVAGYCAAAEPVWADPPPAPSPAPTSGPPAAPRTVIDADGSYAVGTDIEPGTYRTDGPVAGQACYWKRVKDGEMVDNALTKKPQIVQIEPTDTTFKTDRCQPWQKTECPPDCATAPPRPATLPGQLKDLLDHPPQPPTATGGG